jgi:hypothetical protein
MPVAIVAAAVAYGASAAAVAAGWVVAGSLAASLIGAVAAFTVSAAFARKPSQPGLPDLAQQSQTLTTLEPAAAWQVVYGQVRKGGKIVFRHVTDSTDTAQAVESAVIPHTEPYTVTVANSATYSSTASVVARSWDETTGTYTDTPFAAAGGAPAASEYSVSAGTYTFNAADAGKSVQITYSHRADTVAHNRLHLVIVLAAHEVEEIGDLYFNDELVPLAGSGHATGKYANHVYVEKFLGTTTQAASPALMEKAPDKWTANHRLRGQAYIYVELMRNRDLFPSGIPNITAVVKGKKVYDPRSLTTAYSNNWALCVGDYLSNATYGLGAAYGSEIDNTLLSAAANICDEDVDLAAGGTEKRYTCNGIVELSATPQDILEKLLTAGAGRLTFIGAAWKLYAGAYITPTLTFDEGDARGPITVRTRRSRRDVFNGVKGLYVAPANNWQPADFPPVQAAAYVTEDGEVEIWENIDLPYTTSGTMAQRIAKIYLERTRRQKTVSFPGKLVAYQAQPPETLQLSYTRMSWSSKVFEVLDLELKPETDEAGHPVLGVDLQLAETDSAVYTWTTADEQTIQATGATTAPDARQIAPPGIPSVTETLYETTGSAGVKAKAGVSFAASADGQAWRYEVEWKLKSSSAAWSQSGLLNGTHTEALDLVAGVYLFRVRTVSALGVRSEWSQCEKEIIGLSDAPADVAGFAVQSYGGLAKFVWTKSTDLDVRIGGRVYVRWTPLTAAVDWNNGALVNPDGYPGDTSIGFGPLQSGTYFAKFCDSSGNYSVNAASFVVAEALVAPLSTTTSVTFDPAFAGTKVNTAVVDSLYLQLVAANTWDGTAGNVDDWGLVDYLGGIVSAGSCTFDSKIDMGSVQTVRLLADLESNAFDTVDLWDSRTDNMDNWGLIDGSVVEDAEVTIMVRATDDDPAAAPAWGEWHPLGLVADYNARGFEFRADFSSGSVSHNRRISALTVTAKQ